MAAYNTGFADAVVQATADSLWAKREVEVPDAAPQAPEDKELTLDNIAASKRLTELGAQAGDRIEDGKLVRVWSNPEDARDLGTRITAMDLIKYPALEAKGAEVGDRLVNGEIVKSGYDSDIARWRYGWNKSQGIVEMAADTLERWMPLGNLAQTPSEVYGEEFSAASEERRRQLIELAREREIQRETDPLVLHETALRGGAGVAGVAGEIVGTLADPSTLINPTGSLAKAAAGGAGLGLGQSVLEDTTSYSGEVSAGKAAISAVAGGVLGGAGYKLGQFMSKKAGERAVKSAGRFLDDTERAMQDMVTGGATKEQVATAQSAMQGKIDVAEKMTGRTLQAPNAKKRADATLDEALKHDSATARVSNGALDRYLGTLSTRIRNISEPIFGRMRKFEFDIHKRTHDRLVRTQEWLDNFYKLPAAQRREIGRHLANGKINEATGLMPKTMQASFKQVRAVLDEMKGELKQVAGKFDEIENYFPRLVDDWEGLQKKLSADQRNFMQRAIQAYANKHYGGKVEEVTATERAELINKAMRGYYPDESVDGRKLKYLKERSISHLDQDFYSHYADAGRALTDYIRKGTHDIEKRRFFGRFATDAEVGIDTNQSVGKFLDAVKGDLNEEQASELQNLLNARFVGGEIALGKGAHWIRTGGYAGTIANPLSAIIQLGDLATSGALNGVRNTLKGMFGERYVKLVDIGFEKTLSEEMTNPHVSGKILDKLFYFSGFQAVDRLGKEATMNAALRKNFNLAKSAKGQAALRKKWGNIFGEETDSLIENLRTGDVTENVKLLAFNELADIQPIALMEMPEGYLRAKNGRLLYMLKSFLLKQYDIVRRNVYEEFKYGNKMKAVRNATLLGGYLTAANVGTDVTRDMLRGREVRAEDLPGRAVWSLLGVYGMDKYTSQRYLQHGEIVDAALNTLAPAMPLIEAATGATATAVKHYNDIDEKGVFAETPNYAKYLKPIPVAGDLVYNWFFGGAEEWNKDKSKERMKEMFGG